MPLSPTSSNYYPGSSILNPLLLIFLDLDELHPSIDFFCLLLGLFSSGCIRLVSFCFFSYCGFKPMHYLTIQVECDIRYFGNLSCLCIFYSTPSIYFIIKHWFTVYYSQSLLALVQFSLSSAKLHIHK